MDGSLPGRVSRRGLPSEGTLTDLFVKVMALGEPAVVLVTLDLVGIDGETTARIVARLGERFGLPRERVAINTSHTHCGPVFGETLPALREESAEDVAARSAYTSWVEDRIVDCVAAALADRRPARVSWGRGTCSVAVNRRENQAAEVPALRAAGRPLRGPVDHDVPVLAIHDPAGSIRAAVFGYALALKAEFGRDTTWVAGYSNDVMASIPSRRVLREGGYEGARSMVFYGLPAPWAPTVEQTILQAVRDALDDRTPP